MKSHLLPMTVSLACLASPTFAATQGTPGPTSTGTVTINATITPEVNITNLDDFTFTATELQTALNTGAAAQKVDPVCVWSNNVDGSYFITATGDGPGGALSITNGTASINYRVSWRPQAGTAALLLSGTKSPQFRSSATAPDCGGGTTANLAIFIGRSTIGLMQAGTTYTGVLTLLVSPS
jgi:hypothetical protein